MIFQQQRKPKWFIKEEWTWCYWRKKEETRIQVTISTLPKNLTDDHVDHHLHLAENESTMVGNDCIFRHANATFDEQFSRRSKRFGFVSSQSSRVQQTWEPTVSLIIEYHSTPSVILSILFGFATISDVQVSRSTTDDYITFVSIVTPGRKRIEKLKNFVNSNGNLLWKSDREPNFHSGCSILDQRIEIVL